MSAISDDDTAACQLELNLPFLAALRKDHETMAPPVATTSTRHRLRERTAEIALARPIPPAYHPRLEEGAHLSPPGGVARRSGRGRVPSRTEPVVQSPPPAVGVVGPPCNTGGKGFALDQPQEAVPRSVGMAGLRLAGAG